jgi:AbrB family looped-hinge helix DNA binding protein
MRLKTDKARGVTPPKPIRDRLGLRAGSELEIGETEEGITLKPAGHPPFMSKEHDLRVYTGKLPPGFDVVRRSETIGMNASTDQLAREPLLQASSGA